MGIAYHAEAPICLNLRFYVRNVQMISGDVSASCRLKLTGKHLFNVCSLCYVAVAALETSLDSVEGSVVVLLAGCLENFLQDMGSWERDLVCFAVLCDVVVKEGKVIKIVFTALVHTVFPESRRIPTPDTSSSGIRSLSSVLVETFFENEDNHSLQLCDHDTL